MLAPFRAGCHSWQLWAILSAVFAALTAIFAKVGVENVNSDLATFIRTIVVVCVLAIDRLRDAAIPKSGGHFRPHLSVSGAVRARHRRVVAVLFPRAEARRCGASGADRQVERRSGRRVRRGVSRRAAFGAELGRCR